MEQRDAYNRAAMGVDASAGDENGSRTVPMEGEQDGGLNPSNDTENQDENSGLTAEELNYQRQQDTSEFIEENNTNRESDKELLKKDIISRNMSEYDRALVAAENGNFSLMQNLITFVYKGDPDGYVSPEQLKEDLIIYALDADNYEQLCEDIDTQYDKLEAVGVQNINNEFKSYFENAAVTDQLGDGYSVMGWTNDSVDLSIDNSSEISYIDNRIQDLTNRITDFELMPVKGVFNNEIPKLEKERDYLENRKKELEEYNEKYDIAINSDLEDLDVLQLFMRADCDTQLFINETNAEIENLMPMLKQAEQGAIHDGLIYFNDALKELEAGDVNTIESIFTETYGDKPFDPKDLDIDELRDDYLKYHWDSLGLEEEFIQPLIDARDEKIKEYGEKIGTYLQEQMNYEETDTGFNLEISPELIQYAISYAGEKEAGYSNGSGITNMAGITVGTIATATGFGIPVAIIIGMATYVVSDGLSTQANQWENIAIELEHYMDTDKPLEIQVIGDKVFVNEIDDDKN